MLVAGVAGLTVGACDVGGPDPILGGPPPKVVDVFVTASTGGRVPVAPDQSTKAASITSISVKFDRYMEPPTASRQGICLQAEVRTVKTLADCAPIDGMQLAVTYDPVSRTATYFLNKELPPGAIQVTVLTRGENFGFAAFDGVSLKGNVERVFTSEAVGGALEAPPTDPRYCGPMGVGTVLTGRCPSCHQDSTAGSTPIAASMGMYLTEGSNAGPSAAGLRETVINVTAHQTEQGGHAQLAAENPERFGVSMPRVKPGEPGNSYLLYKMLANDGLITDLTLAEGEAARLRDGLVSGQTMPAGTFSISTTEQDAAIVSAWIAAGAQTPECPF